MRNIRLKEKENMAASLHIGVHKKDTNVRLTQPSINKKKIIERVNVTAIAKAIKTQAEWGKINKFRSYFPWQCGLKTERGKEGQAAREAAKQGRRRKKEEEDNQPTTTKRKTMTTTLTKVNT